MSKVSPQEKRSVTTNNNILDRTLLHLKACAERRVMGVRFSNREWFSLTFNPYCPQASSRRFKRYRFYSKY